MHIPPKPFNHVAVSVTDIDLAIRWYRDVMNFTILMGPIEISTDPSDNEIGKIAQNIFGPRFKKLRICHMSSANGVGVELFEFVEPEAQRREDNFDYWKTGFYHICVTDPDIEVLVKSIVSAGGKQRSAIFELVPGSGHKICFSEDPFGNVIEIYSHSYEQFWSNVSPSAP